MSKKRIIYVHAGDTVCLRVINNQDAPANKEEWTYQPSPNRSGGSQIQFTVVRSDTIDLHDPATDVTCYGHQRV